MLKRFAVSCACLGLILGASACERSITLVEETQSAARSNCFECHSDVNTAVIAAEQSWANSRHASGANIDRSTASCNPCHTSEGFIAVASGAAAPADIANPTEIHCFTCHAPHERADFNLRVSASVALKNGEPAGLGAATICAVCHQSRWNVDSYVRTPDDIVVFDSKYWGPHHSTQADLFVGSNGYEYPLVPYFGGPHLPLMPDGCLHCHFDVAGGTVAGGHSFNMRGRLAGEEIINTAACNQAGCHVGEFDDFDHNNVQTDVDALLTTLKLLLVDAGLIDNESHTIDGRVVASADTAGAVWNYLLVMEDRSGGVHNPDYALDLLGSSILFMGGTLPAPVAEQFSLRPSP